MNKFTLNYKHEGIEEYAPVDITFELPTDITIDQFLIQVECFLKACSFHFDGNIQLVDQTINDEIDDSWLKEGGCMADSDKECGCKTSSSHLENDEDEDGLTFHDTLSTAICEADKKLKEWNKGKNGEWYHDEATKEVKKNKWVHGMCNPPAHDAKEYVEDCRSTGNRYNSIDEMLRGLMKKKSQEHYDGAASANPNLYSKWLSKLQKGARDSQLY